MAWRPSLYLIEGELDNTTPGRVTGWMRFRGIEGKVTFDLRGDFHRDIRGAKLRIDGIGEDADEAEAASCMAGLKRHQSGRVGDITAGQAPQDYADYPYVEWYGDRNGRVVMELPPEAVEVIGQPIPWRLTQPISRGQQHEQFAAFLSGGSRDLAFHDCPDDTSGVDDPGFSHWVIENAVVVGEAREIEPIDDHLCIAYVRLFRLPEQAEYGRIATDQLRPKHPAS